MNFKIDENLPGEFVDLLLTAGHSSETVAQENLAGADDAVVAKICQEENRILLTLDLDFSDIRRYPPGAFPGFVVLRPNSQDKLHLIQVLSSVLPLLSTEPIQNRLWIVDESGVRVRGDLA
jgi:predicted nuclease of predicted toxin-antitoxin system